jgi:hypothetical protein
MLTRWTIPPQSVPVAEQQTVIERIVAMQGEGKSLRAICAALTPLCPRTPSADCSRVFSTSKLSA